MENFIFCAVLPEYEYWIDFNEFEKKRVFRTSVCVTWVAWVACWFGWFGDGGGVLAQVACMVYLGV